MGNSDIAQRLVELCNSGRAEDAVAELYADDIVSIEGAEGEAMPARIEGIQAIHEKNAWWFDNHEVHEMSAEGPYVGLAANQFAVRFSIDVTPKDGERMQMTEIALYSTRAGKIAQEEFLYRA